MKTTSIKRALREELGRARDLQSVYRRRGLGWGPIAGDIRFAEAALDRGDPNQCQRAYRKLKGWK